MDLPLSSFVSHLPWLTIQGVDLLEHDAWLPICKLELSVLSVVIGLIVEASSFVTLYNI